jgi:WD40 repeat protein
MSLSAGDDLSAGPSLENTMKSFKEAFAGTACILTFVVVGLWYARNPDRPECWLSFLNGKAPTVQSLPEVSVKRLDWSADGRKLLALSRGDFGSDGPLVVHDLSGSRLPIEIDDPGPASVALSPDGLDVLVATWHGQLLRISLESQRRECLLELPRPIGFCALAVSSDGRFAAAATSDGRIFVLSLRTGTLLKVLQGNPCNVSDLRFSSDARRLVSAVKDGSVDVWDLSRGRREGSFAAHADPAMAAIFLPGEPRIMTAGMDDTIRIWNTADGREEWRGCFDCRGVTTLALSPDGKAVAWGGFSRKIFVWDLERSRKKFEIPTPALAIVQLAWSPDGRSLAAAGIDATIRLYDANTGIEQPGIEASL